MINEMVNTQIAQNIKPVDNSFAMENYTYVTEELGNEKIAEIYRILGPLDYNFSFSNPEEDESPLKKKGDGDSDEEASEEEEKRILQDYYDQRRSGAMYRGEILQDTKRPDGVGIKIHHQRALYEGHFKDGACHGFGRGITSKGEVF